MGIAVCRAVALSVLLFALPHVHSKGVSRIGMYEYYDQFQDIAKAFNSSKFYWVYASNYNNRKLEDKSCVSLSVRDLSESGMNFSTGYIEARESKEKNHTGTFYVSWPVIKNNVEVKRNTSNAVFIQPKPDEIIDATNFSLLYSNYKDCIILLVLNEDIKEAQFRPESMERLATQCVVLLSDSKARTGISAALHPTDVCQQQYYNACIKYKKEDNEHKQHFNASCKSPEITPMPAC
uniref:Putative lipocalin-2 1 n=1 Tax=Amblyomma parvum TaxID=251391 RepID=A0A023FY98_AMBPA